MTMYVGDFTENSQNSWGGICVSRMPLKRFGNAKSPCATIACSLGKPTKLFGRLRSKCYPFQPITRSVAHGFHEPLEIPTAVVVDEFVARKLLQALQESRKVFRNIRGVMTQANRDVLRGDLFQRGVHPRRPP